VSQRTCPRCDGLPDLGIDYSHWPDDGHCKHCGSLNADVFMARLEAGDVELVPTDKNYKVYVRNKGGEPFHQSYRVDSMEDRIKAAADAIHRYHKVRNMTEEAAFLAAMSADDRADFEAYKAGDQLDPMKNWKWTTEDRSETKFYFQHLTEPQMQRFVELLNEKKLRIGEPGFFYRKPFFIA